MRFEEYPVFFAKALRRLSMLDGVEITEQTRREMRAEMARAVERIEATVREGIYDVSRQATSIEKAVAEIRQSVDVKWMSG